MAGGATIRRRGELAETGDTSRDQPVPPRLGYQNFSARRIAFDLLTKTVHVSFEGMSRHPRVIAPDFAKEDVPSDRLVAGPYLPASPHDFLVEGAEARPLCAQVVLHIPNIATRAFSPICLVFQKL
jgi:hypothetical protein